MGRERDKEGVWQTHNPFGLFGLFEIPLCDEPQGLAGWYQHDAGTRLPHDDIILWLINPLSKPSSLQCGLKISYVNLF